MLSIGSHHTIFAYLFLLGSLPICLSLRPGYEEDAQQQVDPAEDALTSHARGLEHEHSFLLDRARLVKPHRTDSSQRDRGVLAHGPPGPAGGAASQLQKAQERDLAGAPGGPGGSKSTVVVEDDIDTDVVVGGTDDTDSDVVPDRTGKGDEYFKVDTEDESAVNAFVAILDSDPTDCRWQWYRHPLPEKHMVYGNIFEAATNAKDALAFHMMYEHGIGPLWVSRPSRKTMWRDHVRATPIHGDDNMDLDEELPGNEIVYIARLFKEFYAKEKAPTTIDSDDGLASLKSYFDAMPLHALRYLHEHDHVQGANDMDFQSKKSKKAKKVLTTLGYRSHMTPKDKLKKDTVFQRMDDVIQADFSDHLTGTDEEWLFWGDYKKTYLDVKRVDPHPRESVYELVRDHQRDLVELGFNPEVYTYAYAIKGTVYWEIGEEDMVWYEISEDTYNRLNAITNTDEKTLAISMEVEAWKSRFAQSHQEWLNAHGHLIGEGELADWFSMVR